MTEDLAKELGVQLREVRQRLGLTQADAAERAGISFQFFARIERGTTLPSVPTLVLICRALHVSADRLLGLAETNGVAGVDHAAEPEPAYFSTQTAAFRRLARRLNGSDAETLRVLSVVASAMERYPLLKAIADAALRMPEPQAPLAVANGIFPPAVAPPSPTGAPAPAASKASLPAQAAPAVTMSSLGPSPGPAVFLPAPTASK